MLERILGTTAKVSALRVLVLNPNRSFSLNQLASEAGCSPSTLQEQIGALLGVVAVRDVKGISVARGSELYSGLRRLFLVEKELEGKVSIFDELAKLGGYFVTGSSALYLRGFGRDFGRNVLKYLFICDRRVAKSRGGIRYQFSKEEIHLFEDRVRPEDFEEIEVLLPGNGRLKKIPVAVPERAIADSLWRINEEGVDVAAAVYMLLENVVDLGRIREHVVSKGVTVEGRLRWLLNEINLESRRTAFNLKGLHVSEGSIPLRIRDEIRGSISRVLGG